MYKNLFILVFLAGFGVLLGSFLLTHQEKPDLSELPAYYANNTASEVGAANVVTAVVVTYRGFDTLGEVTILFVAASLIAMFLKTGERRKKRNPRPSSIILTTAQKLLFPLIVLFGVYVFANGHLTPGGGFQGGAIIATAFLLWLMANPEGELRHGLLSSVESISGVTYVIIGILGAVLGLGFLDNRFMPLGEFGHLFSAGAIPVIYSLIGLKVGSELSNILHHLNEVQNEE
ncbi:MAG: sodium:proton antiporter [Bacteroidetes bacterium HGW-Bacteroidetes-6]|jgi:multicomponent Na+:H+ antiporter subunit B|nr:MAG: sodium:proton antiporter [Bacteroidetes bacterium HGW-Bacteroidetes-6]